MESISPWLPLLLSAATVFIGIACLSKLSHLMSAVSKLADDLKTIKNTAAEPSLQAGVPVAAPAATTAPLSIANRGQFAAVISAAIATAMGTEPQGLRIHSIRQLSAGASADRGSLVAAVAVAVASAMNTEPQGLRIHSITKI